MSDECRTHLPPRLRDKFRVFWILELVMPHSDTARATGQDRNIVAALTSGVLNSHIFTEETRQRSSGTEAKQKKE